MLYDMHHLQVKTISRNTLVVSLSPYLALIVAYYDALIKQVINQLSNGLSQVDCLPKFTGKLLLPSYSFVKVTFFSLCTIRHFAIHTQTALVVK